jgi:hypothetical protein
MKNNLDVDFSIHKDIIKIIEKTFDANKPFDDKTFKIIEELIKKNDKSESILLEDIYNINQNSEEEFQYNNSDTKNAKNLVDKISKTFDSYILKLNELNINEIINNIPNVLNIVFQIDKVDLYLFLPLYTDFLNLYLNQFNKRKIFELRNSKEKIYKDIPYLMYEQNLKNNNTDEKFLNWIGSNTSKKDTIVKEYDKIFLKDYNDFANKLEYHHKNFFKYSTDYLKSPFDKDKIEYIYKKTITKLKKDKNKNIKFLSNKEDSEKLIKSIIQENMLDFIGENVFYEGFLNNSEFYKNKNLLIKKYENQKVSYKLYEYTFIYIFNNSKNDTEYKIMVDEYYKTIRKSISSSMIEFYNELIIYYQMMYYQLNQNLNDNLKIKNLIKIYSKKYLENLEEIQKNVLKKKLSSFNDYTDISEIIENYKEIIQNMKNTDFIFNFNEEELFLLKLSEFYFFVNDNELNYFYNKNTKPNELHETVISSIKSKFKEENSLIME